MPGCASADKGSEQYWSGSTDANHCAVPGCTAVTITISGQAMRRPAGQPAFALFDLGLLMMVPLVVAALGRRKRWQRWVTDYFRGTDLWYADYRDTLRWQYVNGLINGTITIP